MHERPWTKHETCWDFEQRQDSHNEKHEYNPQNIRDFEDMDEKMMNINSESHRKWKAPENKNWQSPSALAQKLAWQTRGKTLTNADQAKLQAPYLPLALGPYENGSLKLRRCVFNKRAIWFPLVQNQEGFSKSFATVTPTFKATISAWCVARCMMLYDVASRSFRFSPFLRMPQAEAPSWALIRHATGRRAKQVCGTSSKDWNIFTFRKNLQENLLEDFQVNLHNSLLETWDPSGWLRLSCFLPSKGNLRGETVTSQVSAGCSLAWPSSEDSDASGFH